jgi:hypothetical protein
VVRTRPRRPDLLSAAGATPGPQAPGEPHPTVIRTPAARPRRAWRLCREQCPGRSRYPSVPGTVAIQNAAGSSPPGRGQLGTAHGRGGSSGDFLLHRGRGPAGVGWTWDGAQAPSPYSVRQPRADLVSSPGPPAGRGPRPGHRGRHGGRARPASHPSVRMPGLRPRTPTAGSSPTDNGVSSLGLAPPAPVRPRLTGRPGTQCLTKRLTSKTPLVWSMW